MTADSARKEGLTWLQEANRRVVAAELMARRSRTYTHAASMVQPGRWLFWALRAVRANQASVRLMASSEAIVRRAIAEGRPC